VDPEASLQEAITTSNYLFFEVIGECYIHGMMEGEALRFQKENSIETLEFELR
jgi:hypothetical protein